MTDVELPTTPDPLERIGRRRLLALGAITGGGLVATAVAACSPAASAPGWSFGPVVSAGPAAAASAPAASAPSASVALSTSHDPSHAPAASSAPAGDHDAQAKAAVDRFLGGEGATLTGQGNQPLAPTMDGETKVFDMTVDLIKHQIDAQSRRWTPSGSTRGGRVRAST